MRIIAFTVITAAVMFFVSFVLFKQLNFIIQLFYPLAAIVLTGAGSFVLRTRSKSVSEASYQQLLKKEIALKEDELQASKAEFSDLQHQLFAETEASEQLRKLAEKRKLVVLELEKQLEDLSHYAIENAHADIAEFSEIICAPDSPLADVLALVAKVAPDDIPVLITGETGTGKELIAKAIHQKSNRNDAAFIAVNCGALSETLLESELFGHEKGSFTGASSRRRGRFELADKGTIFLDEITETSSNFQARLLRILQEGKFERLGGEHTLRVDVRVIAASNKDLPAAIEAGDFRNDLFYRLNGFPLSLPSLKERKQDIPLLCQHFLARLDDNQLGGFSERAMQLLQRYHWPGNVRELQNIVHRGAILARGEKQKLIKVEHLSSELRDGQFSREVLNDYQPLEAQVLESLRQLKFSRSAIGQTARALGNKDRGTITEHFRGICFQHLIQEGYDWDKAAQSVAGSVDASVVSKVRTKLDAYTRNLFPLPEPFDFDANEAHELPSQFKGLPKKFHPYLSEVIQYLRENEHESS